MGQLSFWSADARPRGLGDLEGLLCGPGRAELFGRGSAARLTVVLGPPPPGTDETGEEHAEDGGGADEIEETDPPPDPSPGEADEADEADAAGAQPEAADAPVDPDELAFLDLDPDEIAARLGVRAEGGARPGPSRGRPDVDRRPRHPDDHADDDHPDHPDPAGDDPVIAWRAQAVCCALRARGVPAEIGRAADGRRQVRTAFRSDLVDLARAWTCGGGMKTVPPGLELDGPRLRLWVLAAGAYHGRAYTLGLDPEARALDERLLTASRHLGLGARLVGDARVPVLRIVGARRQGRLGELVGRPPRELAHGVWPV